MKKLNKSPVKNMVVVLGVLSLTAMSCTQSDKSQPSRSEIESKESKESEPLSTSGSGGANSILPVTGLSAKAAGPTVINLTWNKVQNATTYWIYRDNYIPAIVSSTNYIDKGVSAGTTYTYAIAAVVNNILCPKSDSVTVTTPR